MNMINNGMKITKQGMVKFYVFLPFSSLYEKE